MKKLFAAITIALALIINFPAHAAQTLSYIPENPTRALIIIHGYGASGARMASMADSLKTQLPDTALYFPTAPDTGPYGGFQWFVIPQMGENMSRETVYQEMMKDALRNTAPLHDLIKEIIKTQNIAPQNIDIAGFSQGGLMALLSTLTYEQSLGKVVSLSGVPLVFTADFTPALVKNAPDILLIQGDKDNVIPKDSLDLTAQTLTTLKITPKIRVIPNMPHTISPAAQTELINFLQ